MAASAKTVKAAGAAAQSATTATSFDYLVVLDFEATCDESRRFGPQEVIEFPSVVIEVATGRVVDTFHRYVRPVHNPRLTAFCTELTGIQQAQVDQAAPFPAVMAEHTAFLHALKLDPGNPAGPPSFAYVTCGDWDLKTMLPTQLRLGSKTAHPPKAMTQWINIKHAMHTFLGQRPKGMTSMLAMLGLRLEGRHHSGIDDTRNIARCCQALLQRGWRPALTKLPARL